MKNFVARCRWLWITRIPLATLVFGLGITAATANSRAGEEGPDWLPEAVFAPVLDGDRKLGFKLRADTWEGDLPVGETKGIRHEFIKGNDYRFYVSTAVPGAIVSLHIYDQDGNLAESRAWNKEESGSFFAGADIRPSATGTYYLILKVDKSPQSRTTWDMAYAYK